MAESRSQKISRRLQLACEPCKAAKLKCDRSLPVCEQCYKRSREQACKYTEKGLRYNASAQTESSMRAKMERLELLVSTLKAHHSHDSHNSQLTNVEVSDRWSNGGAMTSDMGKLKIAKSGSTQWVGPSSWESVIEDIVDVKTYFENSEDFKLSEESARETSLCGDSICTYDIGTNNIFLTSCDSLRQADLLDRIPPRLELDQYMAAWFNLMDPTRIIVHAPTFQQQYENFWLNHGTIEPAWLALLLSMSSLGAEISGQSLNDVVVLARAEVLRKLATQALILADPTRPQPWLVECLILHIAGLLFHQHDVSSHIWQLMGLTVRLCFQTGYHRDPGRNPEFSTFVCEMRRRVWMVVYELDISISNTLGMVSLVNHNLCDTLDPSNLIESDFSPGQCGSPRPHEECTLVQVEICFARIVRALGDIVVSAHAVVPPSKAEVDAMDRALSQVRKDLPEQLKMKPVDQSFIDSPTEVINRLRLEFAYQKALCVLYRRYLEEPMFERERQRCIEAAQNIIYHTIAMLLAAQPGRQLAPMRILLVRHVHDFTLAAMLICSQLKRLSLPGSEAAKNAVAGNIGHKLLLACQLWETPTLQSVKARTALNGITRFLQELKSGSFVQQSHSDQMDLMSNSASAQASFIDTYNVSLNVEAHHNVSQQLPDKLVESHNIMFSNSLDSSYVGFVDMQEEWPWSENEARAQLPESDNNLEC